MVLSAPYILGILVFVPETDPPQKFWLKMNTLIHFRRTEDKSESVLCSASNTSINVSFLFTVQHQVQVVWFTVQHQVQVVWLRFNIFNFFKNSSNPNCVYS
jgi:hypothetical protein